MLNLQRIPRIFCAVFSPEIQTVFTLPSGLLAGQYQSLTSASQTPARKDSGLPTASLAIDSRPGQTAVYRSGQSHPAPGTVL